MHQRLTTISRAAEQLDVSTKTIRRYIGQGRLTAYRVGDHMIRLDPDEVEGLLRPIPTAGRGDAA